MFDFFVQFIKQVKAVFTKLDAKQKAVVAFAAIFGVVVIVSVMTWTGEQQWVVLQSNLQPQDAQAIVQYLQEQGTPYQLETEGTAILVPQGQELELRLEITTSGLITGGVIGYEIFDRTNIGMTDFIQQVNFKRALEGELSRTIRAMQMIEMAQVRIVVPQQSLFVQDQKPTTASVLLTLQGNTTLTSEQVTTIASLVANSVEGLLPANVIISDSFGSNLSSVINKDPLLALRSEQLRLKSSIELDLRSKLEGTLIEALGPNNSIVNVAVDMNFTQRNITSKTYDPASAVIRSQERESAAGGLSDTVGQASNNERTTTNYEINETIENTVDDFGQVAGISVSVLVNGRMVEQPDGEFAYQPRSPEELSSLEQSVINAIGANTDRGDQVSVVDYQFDNTIVVEQAERLAQQEQTTLIQNIIKWFLMTGAAILFIFVLRSVFRSLDLLLPKPKPAIDIEAEAIEEEISAEAQRRAQMLDQVSRFTKEKPSNVASLLNTWLIEEK